MVSLGVTRKYIATTEMIRSSETSGLGSHRQKGAGVAAARNTRKMIKNTTFGRCEKGDADQIAAREDEVCVTEIHEEYTVATPGGERRNHVRAGVHAWFNTVCTTCACTVCPREWGQ